MFRNSGYWGQSETAPPELSLVVHSCGHQVLSTPVPPVRRPHGRQDYQLIYLCRGRGFFGQNNAREVKEGSLWLYAPGQAQYYYFDTPAEFYYSHFSGAAAQVLLEHAQFESQTVYQTGPGETLGARFEKIIQELQAKPPLYRQICAAQFMELVAIASRRIQIHQSGIPATTYHRLAAVMESMHHDYAKAVSIDQYARQCGLSKFYFSHCFRRITGDSPISYRNKIRIDKAKELLEEHLLSVSEIAVQTGFESSSYFSKAFKSQIGLSPAAYQRRMGGK